MLQFFKNVFNHFFNSNTFQKGAALAYYAVFSLLPMIVIIISLLGIFFGKQAVSGEIFNQLKDVLGNDAAIQIQDIIKNQHVNHNNALTTILGFVTLALSASGMFSQIHSSFNNLWNLKAKPKSSLLNYFRKHFLSFSVLIVLFFIILISTTTQSFLVKHSSSLHSSYSSVYLYEHLISFLLVSLIFIIMFKFLGDAIINWKVAFLGGLFTALLFIFGKIGIAKYIAHSHITTTFGSASVLALLMLWVYYTSQIIFLGASFVKVLSDSLGIKITPNSNAVMIEKIEV